MQKKVYPETMKYILYMWALRGYGVSSVVSFMNNCANQGFVGLSLSIFKGELEIRNTSSIQCIGLEISSRN